LSMAFWMKPTGRGPKKYGSLLGKNLSGGPEEDAYFADIVYDRSVTDAAAPAGTIEFGITADGVNYVVRSNTTLSLDDDTWHLVAVTYDDGSRMAIYIDGELDSELTIDVPEACATPFFTPFALGNLSAGSSTDQYCYNGFLDDVEVYTGVLTAQEVLDIWNRVSRIPGDATGDGIVDEADAQQLAQNWGAGTPGDPATWAMGNFDDDDFVGPKDAAILAANWGYPGESESAAVPEPTMLSLLAGAVLLAAYVRRRPR